MATIKIKIADLIIEVEESSNDLGLFDKYLVDNNLNSNFIVSSNNIDKEHIDIHNQIAEKLPLYNGFLIHGAAIAYKNKAYIFIAPSGTGKTTHIKYWAKHINDLIIINGDKPIVRNINNQNYVYGSPWSGKEGLNSNVSIPLDSIIILKRGLTDEIKEVDPKEYINDILRQVYIPANKNSLSLTITLINSLFENIKTYELYCTNSDSAFYTCFKGLV